ncbi:hypothetical protein MtrunA17_Chr4g0008751 [Medicago truncatula]|uniref:Transmembrane protein n=1 Tax=Medicago truncatula TaxID=3880 RepID=A0A396I2N2_MEDTR|nr:hypothetical protein MtrunA17_Chr4g0008751 [Medicago truncatula]
MRTFSRDRHFLENLVLYWHLLLDLVQVLLIVMPTHWIITCTHEP